MRYAAPATLSLRLTSLAAVTVVASAGALLTLVTANPGGPHSIVRVADGSAVVTPAPTPTPTTPVNGIDNVIGWD